MKKNSLCLVVVFSVCITLIFITSSKEKNILMDMNEKNRAALSSEADSENGREYYQFNLPSLRRHYSSNYNVKFLEDDSFTIGDRFGLPKIYNGGEGKGRYGIITSTVIEAPGFFSGIKIKVEKVESASGSIAVDIQAMDTVGSYTEWIETDRDRDNEVIFMPYKKYKYFRYRVRLVTEHPKYAPSVKGMTVWGIR